MALSTAIRYIPASLFFIFICWITLEADLDKYNTFIMLGRKIPNGDKIGHFLVYGVMAFLLNFSLRFHQLPVLKAPFYTASAIVLAFAICEEFTQLVFESRTFDYLDMAADVAGIAVFSFFSAVWESTMSRSKAYLR